MNNWEKRIFKILFDIGLVVLAYFLALEVSHNSVFTGTPYPYIAFSAENTLQAEDYEPLQEALKPYSVDLVLCIRTWENTGVVLSLVGTEEGLTSYTDWTGIDAGYYGSLIGTDYEVKKYTWENVPEISKKSEGELYFVSEGNAKRDLPADFILGLGVSDLSGWKVDLKKVSEEWFWKTFAAITVIMLLFEGYQALYEAKGYVLRLLFGESVWNIVAKKMLVDFLVIGGVYIGCFWVAGRIFNETIPIIVLLAGFGIFMIGDIGINLLLFTKSWKRVFVRVQESEMLVWASHTIRIIMLTVLIVLCNINITCIEEYVRATAHDDFYNYFREYGVLNDLYNDADYLYLELLKENKAALIFYSEDYRGDHVVNVNRSSFGFLEHTNDSFSYENRMDGKVFIYYPEGTDKPLELAEHVIARPSDDEWDVSFISYRGDVDLPLQRGTDYTPNLLTWVEQPIIIADFRNDLEFFAEKLSEVTCYVWLESYLVPLNNDKPEYVSETGNSYSLESVKKIYTDSILPYLAVVRYVTALLLIMGVMEIVLSVRIVFLEFQMQTTKYISKRLLGAGFVRIYGGFFMTTIMLCIMGGMCSRIILKEEFSGRLCLAVCVITGVVEIFIQVLYVLKLEKANFPKLLKGGIL